MEGLMNNKEQRRLIEQEFSALGFAVIFWNEKPNENGVDCYVQKGKKRPLSVEVKKVRTNSKTGIKSVEPVSKARESDDLIAIIINTEYVLIEPMNQHLKCCSAKGWRPMGWLGGEK